MPHNETFDKRRNEEKKTVERMNETSILNIFSYHLFM
jgi:hypothetical protein